MTITTLGVRGMPLLRFKTGDICYHYTEPCACGRNTIRLSSILGRKGQMIKYKGTTLYPPALFDILDNIPHIKNYIVEVYTNELGTDEILIRIGSENRSEALLKKSRICSVPKYGWLRVSILNRQSISRKYKCAHESKNS